MGVPKFFRWLSERYPKMNQRFGSPPEVETCARYFDGRPPPPPMEHPDPLSTCGLPPPVDRLYVDMNGIIHGCSHNNNMDEEEEKDGSSDSQSGSTSTSTSVSRDDIFRNVCYYLDRVVGDMVQPTELIYLAIDGVAPRAKLNQQRSRRYRSGKEGEIETNIYEAHAKGVEEKQRRRQEEEEEDVILARDGRHASSEIASPFLMDDGFSFLFNSRSTRDVVDGTSSPISDDSTIEPFKEVAPGRFKGKFQTKAATQNVEGKEQQVDASGNHLKTSEIEDDSHMTPFHSNVITPGTPFFQEFTRHLEHFLKYKVSTDPKWRNLTIIMSGPNVPGEGEHKIMDFIRREKARPNYNPNLRHCIMGQDGDLIMLGLATHEPNLVLLRERVVFSMAKQRLSHAHYASGDGPSTSSLDAYLHNAHFEFLHMGVLRDYLAFEFETSNVLSMSPYDLERTIDDFVFMTFFVGNDFLPHMPALDIADNAFDLLFQSYKKCRKKWLMEASSRDIAEGDEPYYLTKAGNILSGKRLEEFLNTVGSHEMAYYDKKKQSASSEQKRMSKAYKKWGMDNPMPDAELVASKEESDRAAYRSMLFRKQSVGGDSEPELHNTSITMSSANKFSPVMTGDFQPTEDEDEDELKEGLISRMGSLLQNSLSNEYGQEEGDSSYSHLRSIGMDDQDLKGRYYHDKFQFTPFDEEKHLALRRAYVEGLVWNLKYYYEGCVSWEWYFPYHYGPMLSDLVSLDGLLKDISFQGNLGQPLKPFEQLMGCMPPSQAKHLPEPYRWLMTDPESPIIDFYPQSFTIDMNGKRWPWEAVTLLPFINTGRLLEAASTVDEGRLTEEEKGRNSFGEALVIKYSAEHSETLEGISDKEGFHEIKESKATVVPMSCSEVNFIPQRNPVLEPKLMAGVKFPLAGYGSLRDAPIQSLWRRKLGIDVFSSRSRYKTACLEMYNVMPPLPPIENLAPKLIGTSIFIDYPYFLEGFVTAVSDAKVTIRGRSEPRDWTDREAEVWNARRDGAARQLLTGEGLTGTGGLIIPEDQPVTLSVRPFEKIVTTKDGQSVKSYSKFEVEVPLVATFWSPSATDDRLNIPSKLERNAFEIAASQLDGGIPSPQNKLSNRPKKERRLFPPRPSAPVKMQRATFSKIAFNSGETRFFSTMSSAPNVETILYADRANSFANKRSAGHKLSDSSYMQRTARTTKGKLMAVGIFAATFLFETTSAMSDLGSMIRKGNLSEGYRTKWKSSAAFSGFPDLRGGDLEEWNANVPPLEFAHGTTTLSFIFQGGIVAAVDSRASIGSFVGSKTTQKVLPVNSHILGTMAGGAADCMFWIRYLKSRSLLHELMEDSRMTVARASRILSEVLFQRRGKVELSVGTMIMGYDEFGPPRIFYVDNTGKRIEGGMFAVGSGSTFALGILDTDLRYNMTVDDAIALGIKAIRHSTFRDAFSGGFINVYLINRDGWRKVYAEDIARLSHDGNGSME